MKFIASPLTPSAAAAKALAMIEGATPGVHAVFTPSGDVLTTDLAATVASALASGVGVSAIGVLDHDTAVVVSTCGCYAAATMRDGEAVAAESSPYLAGVVRGVALAAGIR